ncbi:MAG: hypothetical protein IFJ96_04705, partial [Acidobacteria bacterium]|nr:hypothetical protein [Candidatus Sulfomarinibacter sp. MAG AM2]
MQLDTGLDHAFTVLLVVGVNRAVVVALHGVGHLVGVEKDRSQDLGRPASPVLEGLLDESRERNDQATLVPDAHHDIGGGDLLDAAPLPLHDHHVVDPNRLGQGELQAGDHVFEQRARGEADDEADHSRRGQQARAQLAHAREGHERQPHTEQDDEHRCGSLEHQDLRMDPTGREVVALLHVVPAADEGTHGSHGANHEPRHTGDRQQQENVSQDREG